MRSAALLLLLALSGMSNCLCPENWHPFGRSCYVFIDIGLPWPDAITICEILGGNLVEITSANENAFLQNLTSTNQAGKVWLGINDILQDGQWVLTSSGRDPDYSNWAPGEPNNYLGQNQDCGSMYSDGLWDDESCAIGVQFPFICERSSEE